VAVVAASVSACSNTDASDRVASPPGRARATLPARILGLEVFEENISGNIKGVSGTYLQSLGLFSFREGDELLRATLQIGRFNDVAENEKKRFRDAIIGQLGQSVPIELRVGTEKVFLAAGGEQNIYTWFDDLGFYALSVRSDYPFPRTLVRKLLDLEILA
jgi:hypothetical protein